MREDQKVTGWNGVELVVGSRAVYGSPDPGNEAESTVTVVEITDFDVDYCDATGRPECWPPKIKVRFDDGTDDVVSTHDATKVTWADYPDGPAVMVFAADDLEAVKP